MKKTCLATASILALVVSSSLSFAAEIHEPNFDCSYSTTIYEEDHPDQWKELKEAFVENSMTQFIGYMCTSGDLVFVLRFEVRSHESHEQFARGGIYNLATRKASIEKKRHRMNVTCEIEKTSTGNRIRYLCYNPTVGAGQDVGREYSFRVDKQRSYRRSCTIFFGGSKENECGKWKWIK